MKDLIKNILKEELDWINNVPNNISIELYNYLVENTEVVTTNANTHYIFGDDEMIVQHLVYTDKEGEVESIPLTFTSKKQVFQRVVNLCEYDFEGLEERVLRKTVRDFLNKEVYSQLK
jgi:hypothetical protein